MIAIPRTADLMVPKDVSCVAALCALEGVTVEWDPQPVPQTALKLPVLKVGAQGGGGYHIQPVPWHGVGWWTVLGHGVGWWTVLGRGVGWWTVLGPGSGWRGLMRAAACRLP